MGYRVDYQPVKKLRRQERLRSRAAALTGLCFLLFLFLVTAVWPRGKEVLQGLIFQGNAAVTAGALEQMTSELHIGTPFFQALADFCHTILEDPASAMH